MTTFFGRGGSITTGAAGTQQSRVARSAALLIDFDNVTLGVHSDLGRELKALINSEVFRGKIAVRRAYADWRRYPNYVVPLTEASIDLIFAPAYGSSKKNTTDLRMSADAIELAFTRPEIDTFILLTGDSDFSSTVMKLKEYGKYVIGVGMRESSSDLIIQNCDEYFSYHTLTGLTRTSAGEGMKEDPWELAVRAAQKMVSGGEAMRTDRLKQVMLSIDPGFNEKELGYSKFSRFVAELEKKGLVRLHRLPDGQYEILVDGRSAVPAVPQGTPEAAQAVRDTRHPRDPRRDRRGRRREAGEAEPGATPVTESEPAAAEPAAAGPTAEAERPGVVPPVLPAETTRAAAAPVAPVEVAAAEGSEATTEEGPLQGWLGLLQQAVRELAPKRGESVRDGDVKRRMMDLDPSFDESKLGFSKFSRFLRAAHDSEAIDLQRLDSGRYEVALGSRKFSYAERAQPAKGEARPPAREEAVPTAAREAVAGETRVPPAAETVPVVPAEVTVEKKLPLRGRRRGRGVSPSEGAPAILPGQVVTSVADRDRLQPQPTTPAAGAVPEPAAEEPATISPPEAAAAVAAKGEAPASEPVSAGGRRRRGRGRRARADETPPAVHPDQVVALGAAEPVAEPEAAEPPTEKPARKRRSRGGEKKQKAEAGTQEVAGVETDEVQGVEPGFSAESFGLPTQPSKISEYISAAYRGVGQKTVEPLVGAFGADIFRVFAQEPGRVRELLGDRRADVVLGRWAEDLAARTAAKQPVKTAAPITSSEAANEAAPADAASRRRRRGGRGRRSKTEPAETPVAEVEAAPAKKPRSRAARAKPPAPEPDLAAAPAKRPRSRSGGRGQAGRPKAEPSSS